MFKLLVTFLLATSLGVGYYFYQQSSDRKLPTQPHLAPQLTNSQSLFDVQGLTNVLGTTTSTVAKVGQTLLNSKSASPSTSSQPVVNQVIDSIRAELEQLPQQQYDKIKYEYCKSVVREYESR